MRTGEGGGLDAARRARRGQHPVCPAHHRAVSSNAAGVERWKAESDRRVALRSGLVGTVRHSTGRIGTVRHVPQVMPFTVDECRTVSGAVGSCRGACRTDRHATYSGGRIDTSRTVADADGHGPSRELTAPQQALTYRQRSPLYSRGLMVKIARRAPDMSALAPALAARGSERMASEWRAGRARTIRHAPTRSEFVRTVADSRHLERADDPAQGGTDRHRMTLILVYS
jgi:hypothetical protein